MKPSGIHIYMQHEVKWNTLLHAAWIQVAYTSICGMRSSGVFFYMQHEDRWHTLLDAAWSRVVYSSMLHEVKWHTLLYATYICSTRSSGVYFYMLHEVKWHTLLYVAWSRVASSFICSMKSKWHTIQFYYCMKSSGIHFYMRHVVKWRTIPSSAWSRDFIYNMLLHCACRLKLGCCKQMSNSTTFSHENSVRFDLIWFNVALHRMSNFSTIRHET